MLEGKQTVGRFAYVRYDEATRRKQEALLAEFERLAAVIGTHLADGRAKSLVHTKLEECYMWVGKALRDEQVARQGDKQP